jgi:putative DNA primase/helicase
MNTAELDKRKATIEWGLKSESRARLEAMLALAASEPGIAVTPDQLDSDPWLFNCDNGTIELRTGKLREHRREDLITKICPFKYDPDAKAPLWDSTLEKFLPDADLRDYWQRLVGYCLTGVIRDHILVIAYGTGGNGKSTILSTIMSVFGRDYAMKAPAEMLMVRHNEAHPTERADLFRKRLVVAVETEKGRRLNETLVKELTGGDRIRARRMRENFWEFDPTHKLVVATNYKPAIVGTDEGIWRRLRLVPFTVHVDDARADKTMPEKLLAEGPGILAWCVRGCLAWQEKGLDTPKCVLDATGEYRGEQDVIGSFIAERVIMAEGTRCKASDLYAAYVKWGEVNHEKIVSQTEFGREMTSRGFEKQRTGGIWYLGIGLRNA